MNKFKPKSPDPYIRKSEDMELAKFGHLNALVDVLTQQSQVNTALTAFAAGTQLGATPVVPGFNTVTVGSPNSSLILPSLAALCACTPCGPIAPVVIVNLTANDIVIYPAVGESIDGLAINLPVTINPGESLTFKNVSCNAWQTFNASGTVNLPVSNITSIEDCEGTPLVPVLGVVTLPGVNVEPVSATEALTGDGCAVPLSVCIDGTTITKDLNGCLVATAPAAAFVSAQYSQIGSQPGTIAAQQPITFTTANLTDASITSVVGVGPVGGGTGTIFTIGLAGRYMISYQANPLSGPVDAGIVIYQGATVPAMLPVPYTMIGTLSTTDMSNTIILNVSAGDKVALMAAAGNTAAVQFGPNSSTTNAASTTISFVKIS